LTIIADLEFCLSDFGDKIDLKISIAVLGIIESPRDVDKVISRSKGFIVGLVEKALKNIDSGLKNGTVEDKLGDFVKSRSNI